MKEAAWLSYSVALILLCLCVLLCCQHYRRPGKLIRILIIAFGMVPGVVGVVVAFSLSVLSNDLRQGLAAMWAWLLLEIGALQLTQLLKKIGPSAAESNPTDGGGAAGGQRT